MTRVDHLPKNLPSKEIPFTIEVTGSLTGHPYKGSFVVRVPSARDVGRIGLELARLNEGIPAESLDLSTFNLHNTVAFLRVALVEAPNWFKNPADSKTEPGMDYGLDTLDVNVPVAIFKEAQRLVQQWQDSLMGQPRETEDGQQEDPT